MVKLKDKIIVIIHIDLIKSAMAQQPTHTVLYVRHGECHHDTVDSDLTDIGLKQAKQTASEIYKYIHLCKHNHVVIIVSPYKRCVSTANQFMIMMSGKYDFFKITKEVAGFYPQDEDIILSENLKKYNVVPETWCSFCDRIKTYRESFTEELDTRWKDSALYVIFTHRRFISNMISYQLNEEPEQHDLHKIDDCSITKTIRTSIDVDGVEKRVWMITEINDVSHLSS